MYKILAQASRFDYLTRDPINRLAGHAGTGEFTRRFVRAVYGINHRAHLRGRLAMTKGASDISWITVVVRAKIDQQEFILAPDAVAGIAVRQTALLAR